jgi:hypothetical protein
VKARYPLWIKGALGALLCEAAHGGGALRSLSG